MLISALKRHVVKDRRIGRVKSIHGLFGLAFLVTLGACDKPKKSEGTQEKPPTITSTSSGTSQTKTGEPTAPTKKAGEKKAEVATAKAGEIVFDPLSHLRICDCHHNHCHVVGGGVESYKQVMENG